MQLLKLPSGVHQCLIYATAMLLDRHPDWVILKLGHDGAEIWWPELEDPWNRRGVHIQEILDVVETVGHTLVCYQLMPTSVPIGEGLEVRLVFDPEYATERFSNILGGHKGLLITERHACAWNGWSVYDPNGRIADISKYRVKEFWRLV